MKAVTILALAACLATAALAQNATAPAPASKGTSALDAMLSTSKASAPDAKNSDSLKNATAAAPAAAPAAPAPAAAAPAKQAAPSSAAGCVTPLAFIQNDARFKKLTQLIDATPPAARLADILDSPDVAITMLAPTDDAIADSLGKQGLSFSDLVANPTLSLMVLQFHLLPNPIPMGEFINGYSFNTLLPGDNYQDAIGVAKGGDKVKLRGPHNGATLLDTGNPACISTVYAIDGLLLPKRAISGGGAGGAATAKKAPAAVGSDAAVAAGDAPADAAAVPASRKAAPGGAAAADATDAPAAKPAAAAPKPPPEGARRAVAKESGASADPNAPTVVDVPASG